MPLRPAKTVRKIERAYTRVSHKVLRKNYIKGVPQPKIHLFEMGNPRKKFELVVYLVAKTDAQIRHNALEAARIIAHKLLERKLGSEKYFFKILKFPHQVLREKPIATGAGADRYSQGMRLAFGKPRGLAVRAFRGENLMLVRVDENNLEVAKQALRRASSKLPLKTSILAKSLATES